MGVEHSARLQCQHDVLSATQHVCLCTHTHTQWWHISYLHSNVDQTHYINICKNVYLFYKATLSNINILYWIRSNRKKTI